MSTYRETPRIANSDLGEFKHLLVYGQPPQQQESAALQFGTRFHHHLLIEREILPTGLGTKPMLRMLEVMRSHTPFVFLLQEALPETAQFWDDPLTGLPCKAQLDLLRPAEELIIDVKTTSASSQGEFLANCLRYEYDRQAAYYIDGCRAAGQPINGFIIFGIQKQKPHQVYTLDLKGDDAFVEGGRRKYRKLLSDWLKNPYTPSSWSKLNPKT